MDFRSHIPPHATCYFALSVSVKSIRTGNYNYECIHFQTVVTRVHGVVRATTTVC